MPLPQLIRCLTFTRTSAKSCLTAPFLNATPDRSEIFLAQRHFVGVGPGAGRGKEMNFVFCTKARLFLVLLMEGDYRTF